MNILIRARGFYSRLGFLICFFASICLPGIVFADGWNAAPAVVYVLRHAEKAGITNNSELSEGGHLRAQALVDVLGQEKISAIYSTQLIRAKQTVEPLAAQQHLAISVLNDKDYTGLCNAMKREHQGGTLVVVGHSYTIPKIFRCLTGKSEDIHAKYGQLFAFTFDSGSAAVEVSHFGRQ